MHHQKEHRTSIATLLIQILSIIFSILLALSVNEWKERKSNKTLAFSTLLNFREEIVNNKQSIESALHDQRKLLSSLESYAHELRAKKNSAFSVPEINLPDVLTTAWETALVTKALIYIDYDVILKLSELYLHQKWLVSLEDKVFQTIFSPSSYEKKNTENLVAAVYASLKNIMKVEETLLTLYDHALEKIDSLTGGQYHG